MRGNEIKENLNGIRKRIDLVREGRPVRLVAVSKTKPAEDLMAAYEAGQRHFGENVNEWILI